MPIRIPTLSGTPHPPAPYLSLEASVDLLVKFLRDGAKKNGTMVLTGAGVSVDSGIRVRPAGDLDEG